MRENLLASLDHQFPAWKYLSEPMRYIRHTLDKLVNCASVLRLDLLVPRISSSRYPQAGRGGGDRRSGERNGEVSFRPLRLEKPPQGVGVGPSRHWPISPGRRASSPRASYAFSKGCLRLIKREEGYTLNEVLVSIALIAIGVLGFSLNTVSVIQGNQISANLTIATNLAQDKLEELNARTGFANVDNCSTTAGDQKITATGAAGGIFDRCWRIDDSPLGPGLKQIDVIVSWRDYLPRSVTLSTLVFTE